MDEKYTAAAIRRTWDAIAGRAFEETGKVRMTGDEVRRFMSDYIENKAETSRQKFWDLLSPEDKHRILELAFPHGSYTRPEKGSVFISAPASVETSKLRETLVDRGFDPFTLEDAEAGGRSISDLINDSIDRADLVLVVVPHHGAGNPNVFIELGYALAKKKRILALVPPGEELPLLDVPYLRTELDNLEAIGFGLDQVLAAPKGKGKGKCGRTASERPSRSAPRRIGSSTRPAQTAGRSPRRNSWTSSAGLSRGAGCRPLLAGQQPPTARWTSQYGRTTSQPLIKNPVVIELKSRLRGKEHFEQTIAQAREGARHDPHSGGIAHLRGERRKH